MDLVYFCQPENLSGALVAMVPQFVDSSCILSDGVMVLIGLSQEVTGAVPCPLSPPQSPFWLWAYLSREFLSIIWSASRLHPFANSSHLNCTRPVNASPATCYPLSMHTFMDNHWCLCPVEEEHVNIIS